MMEINFEHTKDAAQLVFALRYAVNHGNWDFVQQALKLAEKQEACIAAQFKLNESGTGWRSAS